MSGCALNVRACDPQSEHVSLIMMWSMAAEYSPESQQGKDVGNHEK
jgi:hypothetical protein